MLIRMNQEGYFEENENEDGEFIDLVTELYVEEQQQAEERQLEKHAQLEQAELVADEHEDIDLDHIRMRERYITSPVGFQKLRNDLILAVRERGR